MFHEFSIMITDAIALNHDSRVNTNVTNFRIMMIVSYRDSQEEAELIKVTSNDQFKPIGKYTNQHKLLDISKHCLLS